MANAPSNSNYANHKSSGTDTSISVSLAAGGAKYQVPSEGPTVIGSGHPVVSRADGALWDTVAGAFVSIHNTTIGTNLCSKNGQ